VAVPRWVEMADPNQKLAESLRSLRELQRGGRRVFQSGELTRVHRERLLRNGFLQEATKGWLISSGPDVREGDSTPWYASFWEFCARYCAHRFGDDWHLSPEQSLLLQAENTVIPPQIVIYTPKGANNAITLPFGTSLYDLKAREPSATDLILLHGLRLFSVEAALVRVSEGFLARHPIEAQVALLRVADESQIVRRLLEGGHSAVAGRLAGAFRRVGRPAMADEIAKAMRSAGYEVRERDPLAAPQTLVSLPRETTPIVARIRTMWEAMREIVIARFPKAPGIPRNTRAYLQLVDEVYKDDAYHSLSIEGYQVTLALIERVRAGGWDPAHHPEDRENRDALAARGYWQAFQSIKPAIREILAGRNAGGVVRVAHRDWYRELFQPFVAAGVLPASALAGYRNEAVFLRTSRYVPPRWEAVRDAMSALFDLLQEEQEHSVRAVLGHWLFGYIHPYPDGNGRMARFVMNAMLAGGGYPWTVIRVRDRAAYLAALDQASIDMKIRPFVDFISARVRWALRRTRSSKNARS
jgi:fido (protein-threonine AMPylation protein)